MALLIPIAGELVILSAMQPWLNTLTCRLYQNDHVPAFGDTVSDYEEADFGGYEGLPTDDWNDPFASGEGKGEITHPTLRWEMDSEFPQCQVFGYYITNDDGELVWAERRPGGPITMNFPGKPFTVKLRQSLRNDF